MIRLFLFSFLLYCSTAAFGQQADIPAAISVSKSNNLVIHTYAKGVQVYVCQQNPKDTSSFIWVFKEPRATLYSDSSYLHIIGKHYYNSSNNPTWENTDGSKVTGAKIAQANSTDSGAIPWLLLKTTNIEGKGSFKPVTFIQRIFTKGGKPVVNATRSRKGEILEVPYEAEYLFYN